MADKVKQVGDLILKAQTEQKDAAAASASSAKEMVGSLTRAADEAARLASALASASVSTASAAAAGATQQSQVPTRFDMYGRPIYDPAKAQEQQANTDAYLKAVTSITAEASDAGLPEPAEPSVLADGGIIRRTGIALVHKGEVVLNEVQQRQMGNQYSFSIVVQGGANVSALDRATVRKLVREEIIPEIERVQDAG